MGGSSPFHEVDHIDDARCADHGLVSEDGPHGLFHTELRLQGRQKRLNLLPERKEHFGNLESNLLKLAKI